MIYDLHTHSTASDGSLDPAELVNYAQRCEVDVLSITDHDSVAAYTDLDVDNFSGITIVRGIEFSTTWSGRNIHIVGLNVDPEDRDLIFAVESQQKARQIRAIKIAERLQKIGMHDPLAMASRIAGDGVIGRPHFARAMVETGFVKDTRTAFRRYLGTGKAGDIRQEWASMQRVVEWIRSAHGTPVLAHPAKYKMTMTRLRELAVEFRSFGGLGIEVVCGQQSPNTSNKLATLANDLRMQASCGSDFHSPDNAWSRPGGFATLPRSVTPVWDTW